MYYKLDSINLAQSEIEKVERKFPGITKGIGKLIGTSVQLHIDSSVPPVARKHVRIPFQLRKQVESEA